MTRNRSPQSQRPRRGWTLIELLVICSAAAILSVTGALTISMLMNAESRGAESLVRQNVISRLSARFRQDLHASATAAVEGIDGGFQNRLVLDQPDGSTIVWRITTDAVERRVTGNAVENRRDRFQLPEHEMHFESTRDGRILRLVIAAPGQRITDVAADELPTPVRHLVTIEATAAWDLRHTRPAPDDARRD